MSNEKRKPFNLKDKMAAHGYKEDDILDFDPPNDRGALAQSGRMLIFCNKGDLTNKSGVQFNQIAIVEIPCAGFIQIVALPGGEALSMWSKELFMAYPSEKVKAQRD